MEESIQDVDQRARNGSFAGAMERLQEERVDLEVRLAGVEDTASANQRTTEQHIDIGLIREDIERVEREAEELAAAEQVRRATTFGCLYPWQKAL